MPEQETLPLEQPKAPPVAPTKLPEESPAEGAPVAPVPADKASATPAGETPAPTPEQAEKRLQSRFDRKIDKLHRRAAEAQARAELAEKQLAEFRRPAPLEGEPKLEQFDYDPEKYAAAKAEFAKTQTAKELQAQAQSEAVRQEQQRLVSSWEEKVARAEDKYDDFETIVGEMQPVTPLHAAIMEAENAEDLAYYLGKNPKEAQRIASLSLRAGIREIGKLEAKLLAEPQKPITPSKAPPPIAPLSGAASAPSSEPSESDDYKTWLKKRQRQVHSR